MIDLTILKTNPELANNVKLEVSGADLLAFGESIHKQASAVKPPEKDEIYLTAEELAKILKVSLVTIWSWDKKGITKPLRIGNQKRYRKSDIENFLQES
jgi:predicted DNA-binding transcriptional regulator AlpA